MGGQHPLFYDSCDGNCCCNCSLEPRGWHPFIASCNARDHSLSWLWGSWWVYVEHAQKIPLRKAPLSAALTKRLRLQLWGAGNMLPDGNCPYCKALLPQLRESNKLFTLGLNKLVTGKGALLLPFSVRVFSPSHTTLPNWFEHSLIL